MSEAITEQLTPDEIKDRILNGVPGPFAIPEEGSTTSARPRPPQEPHTWDTIDLSALSDSEPAEATIMQRTDGKGLIYPGTRNLLFAPFESCKTFVSLLACAQILEEGGTILYIDFESSPRAIASRLRQMGAPLTGFGYIRPVLPVDENRLNRALDELQPTLVVVDACAEAMVTHDLDENNNRDYMRFSRMMLEPIEERGIAVLLLDHMGKAQGDEARKYPRGASAKMATVSGTALRIEVEVPFRRGFSDGQAKLYVAKDREGAVRAISNVDTVVADLRLQTWEGRLYVELDPPIGAVSRPMPSVVSNMPTALRSVPTIISRPYVPPPTSMPSVVSNMPTALPAPLRNCPSTRSSNGTKPSGT